MWVKPSARRVVGYDGDISWDAGRPDGTPRKLLDVSRALAMGWKPRIGLEEGLRRTYEWYLAAQQTPEDPRG